MSRFIGQPVKHVETDAKGQTVAFTWRGVTYRGKVIHPWILSDRWREQEAQSNRRYFRLMTSDFQVFDTRSCHSVVQSGACRDPSISNPTSAQMNWLLVIARPRTPSSAVA